MQILQNQVEANARTYPAMKEMREKAEAVESKNMNKRTDFEGRRLLAVVAAARAGFRYTENLDGFGEGDEPCVMVIFLLASESMAGDDFSKNQRWEGF